jgi:hypothetical protein
VVVGLARSFDVAAGALTALLALLAADGAALGQPPGQPIPAPGEAQPNKVFGVRVADRDSVGDYRIVANVTDHVAGVSLRVEQTVTVEAYAPAAEVARSAAP